MLIGRTRITIIKIEENNLNDSNKSKINSHVVKENDVTDEVMHKRKSIVILSDSMLNQIDEPRLCKYGDVKVRCHEGCIVNPLHY